MIEGNHSEVICFADWDCLDAFPFIAFAMHRFAYQFMAALINRTHRCYGHELYDHIHARLSERTC